MTATGNWEYTHGILYLEFYICSSATQATTCRTETDVPDTPKSIDIVLRAIKQYRFLGLLLRSSVKAIQDWGSLLCNQDNRGNHDLVVSAKCREKVQSCLDPPARMKPTAFYHARLPRTSLSQWVPMHTALPSVHVCLPYKTGYNSPWQPLYKVWHKVGV